MKEGLGVALADPCRRLGAWKLLVIACDVMWKQLAVEGIRDAKNVHFNIRWSKLGRVVKDANAST